MAAVNNLPNCRIIKLRDNSSRPWKLPQDSCAFDDSSYISFGIENAVSRDIFRNRFDVPQSLRCPLHFNHFFSRRFASAVETDFPFLDCSKPRSTFCMKMSLSINWSMENFSGIPSMVSSNSLLVIIRVPSCYYRIDLLSCSKRVFASLSFAINSTIFNL